MRCAWFRARCAGSALTTSPCSFCTRGGWRSYASPSSMTACTAAPSGGVEPGESFEEGARREALEETGLAVCLERYLIRVEATFVPPAGWPIGDLPPGLFEPDNGNIRWWTHIVAARVVGEPALGPRDTREIAEARWMTLDELQGPVRERLVASGRALFAYRVALTDATVAALRAGYGKGVSA